MAFGILHKENEPLIKVNTATYFLTTTINNQK